mmetsp:Transcript_16930/g.42517  ORF Transcript_16930/g.42517 Transcript_16930/m.42517 type:complete len:113 (+) Transcript_16930:1046-1384(+)
MWLMWRAQYMKKQICKEVERRQFNPRPSSCPLFLLSRLLLNICAYIRTIGYSPCSVHYGMDACMIREKWPDVTMTPFGAPASTFHPLPSFPPTHFFLSTHTFIHANSTHSHP